MACWTLIGAALVFLAGNGGSRPAQDLARGLRSALDHTATRLAKG